MSDFPSAPLPIVLSFVDDILSGSATGEYCQNASITPIGEFLIEQMMLRGMIIEIDHFPQWSYQRVYELLEDSDYPAAGTHRREWNGRLYALGGISSERPRPCHDPETPGTTLREVDRKLARIDAVGAYPGIPLSFDLNGFAAGIPPRFGEEGCEAAQANPVTWPFDSYAGDTTFTQPTLGTRTVDYNEEGMLHIGLLPEYIQDLRTDAGDEAVEPLFRGAEAYIRMWEKAEEKGSLMRGE
ncbi:MAG TPA: hypothetical protein DFR83_04510 [Deltaproteobacteria bacterium]|nr:hypothetical protein [Deltaproteobacteria bacterium]